MRDVDIGVFVVILVPRERPVALDIDPEVAEVERWCVTAGLALAVAAEGGCIDSNEAALEDADEVGLDGILRVREDTVDVS